ncbi:MAG: acyl-CoA dehydrogenase family protein [Acidimicrobiia bacterium]|nr:acyl-CoA dehydrogenase family protein [Acidimicrobiia bacterium]
MNDEVHSALVAEMAGLLEPRSEGGEQRSVLGAGSDDIEAGREYLRTLGGTGWMVPTWPREYGGMGLDAEAAATVRTALSRFHSPDLYPFLVGLALVGPTLLAHGSPGQCARFLPAIATGREIWCQMFSEPDAGSDLANLSTRARRDGDFWRIGGAKLWTSRAHYSRRGLLLARHDASLPKHLGVTAFALDMTSPGVTIRPLVQMNGDAHFSEVFLDDVTVVDSDRIGEVGEGWRVALTTLAHERGAGTAGSGSLLDIDRLLRLLRETGGATDPLLRDRFVRMWVEARVAALTARRAGDALRAGRAPGPEGSGMKLRGSEAFRRFTDLAMSLLGPRATARDLADDDAIDDAEWETLFLTAPSLGIRGGTDEIQRNILGERVLGLPREPRLDRDLPYDQLPRSARS